MLSHIDVGTSSATNQSYFRVQLRIDNFHFFVSSREEAFLPSELMHVRMRLLTLWQPVRREREAPAILFNEWCYSSFAMLFVLVTK